MPHAAVTVAADRPRTGCPALRLGGSAVSEDIERPLGTRRVPSGGSPQVRRHPSHEHDPRGTEPAGARLPPPDSPAHARGKPLSPAEHSR